MPYRDIEQRRAVQRECQRRKRRGLTPSPRQPSPTLVALRCRAVEDVLVILEQEMGILRTARGVKPVERGRTLAYICGIALRAIEARDLVGRIEALEAALGGEDLGRVQ